MVHHKHAGLEHALGKHGKTGGFVIILTLLQALGGYYKRFPFRWSAWHRITGVTAIFWARTTA